MKKIIVLVLIFCCLNIYAQYNYYSGLQQFYSEHPKPAGDGEEIESSEYNSVKRDEMIWGPRLFPHGGDEGAAATALIDFVNNYNPVMSDFNPVWQNVGPLEKITGNSGVGRMGRICFDPQYNDATNKTIYATSCFGGLWRTEDNGQNWYPLADDLLFTAMADVAVSYQNSNHIFLATGIPDGRFEYFNTYNHINSIHTFGVYRSTDYGITWEDINDDDFIDDFEDGGTIRRMIINPENESQLFVATTKGIYMCENATEPEPYWQHVLYDPDDPSENDFRGLAFKPQSPNIVFAGGLDIYMSIDEGNTFNPISVPNLPIDYEISRVNLATTPADPDLLYAYIIGSQPGQDNKLYIYVYYYSTGEWQYIYEYTNSSLLYTVSKGRMGFAVSPINPYEIYFGHTEVQGTSNWTTIGFTSQAEYFESGFHADVHGLTFQPNVSDPDLFAATDGGINRKDLINGTGNWSYLYNGLSVNTIYGFDDSDYNHEQIMIGNWDCGVNKVTDYEGKDWNKVDGSDGLGIKFDNSGLDRWFYMRAYLPKPAPVRYNY